MKAYITSPHGRYRLLFLLLGCFWALGLTLPAFVHAFTCGPHMLTYAVYGHDGASASGVRCLKVDWHSPDGISASFDWYGEGNWGAGPYRHIGTGYTNRGEFGSLAKAADIYGNGEVFNGFFMNLIPEVLVGSWPAPQEIRISGEWGEIWRLVTDLNYTPLSLPIVCGPHFTSYHVQDLTGARQGSGLRCVVDFGFAGFFVWFGTGEWEGQRYSHLGHFNLPSGTSSGVGQATDLCDPHFGVACNDFPAASLIFTPAGNDYRVTGAWSELWFIPRVSVLTVNLRNLYDVPCGNVVGRWQERYTRIASWMAEVKEFPDVIALQEAPGWWWCPFNWRLLPDYAAMHHLISAIQERTNVFYRIAYLVGGPTGGGEGGCGVGGASSAGGCSLWGSRALLYNPERLRNVTAETQEPSLPHQDEDAEGVYLRKSLPCCNPARDRAEVCSWVDDPKQTDKCGKETGAGLAWVATFKASNWGLAAAFARMELRYSPGQYVHIYNVHLGLDDDLPPSIQRTKELITAMEERYSSQRYFPPIVLGDFNMTEGDTRNEFPNFDVAGYTPVPDVIGVLIAKRELFPSTHSGTFQPTVIATGPTCDSSVPVDVLWSDHCSVFVRFHPVP